MGDGRKGYYYVGSGYVRDFMYLCSVKKPLLYEISVIRPLVIFLLVVYHALCVFTGGWQSPPRRRSLSLSFSIGLATQVVKMWSLYGKRMDLVSKWKFFSHTLKSGIFSHKSALRNISISNGYSLQGWHKRLVQITICGCFSLS